MDARLIVESDDACDLASRLAALTGDSVTDAVTKALRAEVERRERDRDIVAKAERMMAIGREIRARIKEPVSSDTRDFYDEDGFPV